MISLRDVRLTLILDAKRVIGDCPALSNILSISTWSTSPPVERILYSSGITFSKRQKKYFVTAKNVAVASFTNMSKGVVAAVVIDKFFILSKFK